MTTYGFTIYDVEYYEYDNVTKGLYININKQGIKGNGMHEFTVTNVGEVRTGVVSGKTALEVYF